MPGWYLMLSAAVALLVLAGVAYSALADRRRAQLEGGAVADFDVTDADAPTRREAEEGVRGRIERREEVVTRER